MGFPRLLAVPAARSRNAVRPRCVSSHVSVVFLLKVAVRAWYAYLLRCQWNHHDVLHARLFHRRQNARALHEELLRAHYASMSLAMACLRSSSEARVLCRSPHRGRSLSDVNVLDLSHPD